MLFVRADWVHRQVQQQRGLQSPVTALHFASRTLQDDPLASDFLEHHAVPPASDVEACGQIEGLCRWVVDRALLGAAGDTPQGPPELAPAMAWLHSQEGRTWPTVQALVRECGMTPSQFIRRFKGVWGIAPGEYARNLRVRGARRLIGNGASLVEAAHAMGFSDQAHMQRTFKALHAMTPGCYALPARRK